MKKLHHRKFITITCLISKIKIRRRDVPEIVKINQAMCNVVDILKAKINKHRVNCIEMDESLLLLNGLIKRLHSLNNFYSFCTWGIKRNWFKVGSILTILPYRFCTQPPENVVSWAWVCHSVVCFTKYFGHPKWDYPKKVLVGKYSNISVSITTKISNYTNFELWRHNYMY